MQGTALETPKRLAPYAIQTESCQKQNNSTPFSPGNGNCSPLHKINSPKKLLQNEQSEFQSSGVDRVSVFSPAPRFPSKDSPTIVKRKRDSEGETEVRFQAVVTYGRRNRHSTTEGSELPPTVSTTISRKIHTNDSPSSLKRKQSPTKSIPSHESHLPSASSPSTSTCRASYLASNKKSKLDLPICSPKPSSSSSSSSHHHHNTTTQTDELFNDPYYFIYNLPPYEELDHSGLVIPLLPPPVDDDNDDDNDDKQINHLNTTTSSLPSSISSSTTTSLKPLTIVLDLDETLVHCSSMELSNYDFSFPLTVETKSLLNPTTQVQVYCSKRPYLDEFLDWVYEMRFEVVIYTASQRSYADSVINYIEGGKKRISHRLFREHCLNVSDNFIKDLHVLGRDLDRVVIVDNSPNAFGYNLDNGIPIEGWFGGEGSSSSSSSSSSNNNSSSLSNQATISTNNHAVDNNRQDVELLKLKSILKKLSVMQNVRPYVRDRFKTREIVNAIVNKLRSSVL